MPKVDLSGAYGVSTPPSPALLKAHPERVQRYLSWMRVAWVVRLGALAALLYFLYAARVI